MDRSLRPADATTFLISGTIPTVFLGRGADLHRAFKTSRPTTSLRLPVPSPRFARVTVGLAVGLPPCGEKMKLASEAAILCPSSGRSPVPEQLTGSSRLWTSGQHKWRAHAMVSALEEFALCHWNVPDGISTRVCLEGLDAAAARGHEPGRLRLDGLSTPAAGRGRTTCDHASAT